MDTLPDPGPSPDEAHLRRRRILRVAIPAAILVLLVAGYFVVPGILVRRRAAALGFSLDWDTLEIHATSVLLRGARVTLLGVDGLTITADRVDVARSGLDATAFDAERVDVAVLGSATDRVIELAAWSSDHPTTYHLPATAGDVRVAWRARADDAPWLALTGGTVKADGKTGHLDGAVSVGGVPLGHVSTLFSTDGSGVTVDIGKAASGEAPLTARVTTASEPPRVDLTLRPVKLSSLGASLGLALPAAEATASGRAELTLARRGSADDIEGSASILLDGWVPPHPREVSSIFAGKKTSIAARISVAESRTKVTLSDVVVHAGKLTLKGSGAVTRAQDHAVATLELAGAIACADLARAAANDTLGGLLGELAGGAVEGSVTVNVSVEADSRDLRDPKVRPRFGVGCGLKLPGL